MSFALSDVLWKFFPKIKSFPASKKKRFLSTFGLSNPTAKAFFLADYCRRNEPKKVFVLLEKKNEVFEYVHLFQSFLQNEYTIFAFSPTLHEKTQQQELFLFAKHLATQNEKTIFLLPPEKYTSLFVHAESANKKSFILTKGQKLKNSQLLHFFEQAGYTAAYDPTHLEPGEFIRLGDTFSLFPVGQKNTVQIETEYDSISKITEAEKDISSVFCFPAGNEEISSPLWTQTTEKDLLFIEEFSDIDESLQKKIINSESKIIESSTFPRLEDEALHLRFLSLVRFYTLTDFLNDIKEKVTAKWKIILSTKRIEEMKTLFTEEHIPFSTTFDAKSPILLIDAQDEEFIPPSFQNPEEKILFLTDREVFHMKTANKKAGKNQDMNDFLTSLKVGDFVVHADHGIGKFLGISEQTISGVTREYLEVEYLKNDKLFVPIASSDKISRYIVDDDKEPKLTRLGGAEWQKTKSKVKVETEKIAKELLELYAARAKAHAIQCGPDSAKTQEFENEFPYAPTPGQIASIRDIKKDMESTTPMDRLVCGDVGFGKTEVAMRAAFKAVENGMQVAVLSPITILADQHYKSFSKRMFGYDVRIEVLSRFKTPAEQKEILQRVKEGKVDILIGTHRIFSEDVAFKNLGLLIIDEEQRFGVKQKEKLKALKKEVHILTMTATPIPRTLNLALHNLRAISTITTPPPGRLPVITEVRKYSDTLIKDAILKEKERNGQVYFLHNRVETIEGIAEKLRLLVPECSFVVAHGQLSPHILEEKIRAFKDGEFDVLISSTIIENGIDLANANTMIINQADTFGLSQLYQLRGRIGRSNKQGYAYLLYNSQKLPLDSKKRLRAIVEASELGSGFQLSMRDLEIRGAGDVLGVSQHGSVHSVGVQHFLKLLKKTIKDMEFQQKNKNLPEKEEEIEVQIDVPISAFIPSFYIPDNKEKILTYQRFAGVETIDEVYELAEDLAEEYGRLPPEVKNLVHVLELKLLAKKANVKTIRFQSENVELHVGKKCTAKEIFQLLAIQPEWGISGSVLHRKQKDLGVDFIEILKEAMEGLQKKEIVQEKEKKD